MATRLFERFTVIPAIDLKAGKVVRLLHGAMERATIYGDDPAQVARQFEQDGAELIHVVDLDGAIAGEPRNLEAIREIRETVNCRMDISGGLRTIETIRQVIELGADYISIGSAAFLDPKLLKFACEEFPGRVLGSIDARDGRLAIRGWVETSPLSIADAIDRFRSAGAAMAILTDIARDGAQTGVNLQLFAEVVKSSKMPIIASGGIASLEDVRTLTRLFNRGVIGAIVGRALYERKFSIPEAIASARASNPE
jgi:phosphoribosylformimino-5-aminoimidazole carboxamide ribotide isomerase